jgi:formylglycine-generating enzyme required for sulfatase activity
MVLAQSEQPAGPSAGLPRVFRDCPDCPEMVEIPAGKFLMGSSDGDNDEKPVHEVHLDKPIAVGKYEVTFAEWEACAADGGCQKNKQPGDGGFGRGRHPVINVSWSDARDYAAWLSAKTGKSYRLLSEAEWEYAARAGTTGKYAFGETLDAKQAKFQTGKQGIGETVEVGSYPPNAWGLHDMHGNVWEWVEDCYFANYDGAPADGSARSGPDCGPARVLRGGSWDYTAEDLRSAIRYRIPPYYRVDEIGFRLAREL